MAESAGPDQAAARLQAALERIARAADRRHGDEAAVEARARRAREIASRLDALIEELRSSLDD
jgi:hypothetical protein